MAPTTRVFPTYTFTHGRNPPTDSGDEAFLSYSRLVAVSRPHDSSQKGGADLEAELSKGDVTSMTTRVHGHMPDSRAR
jgi:hypothetical protein